MSVEGHRHDQYARRDHTHPGGGVSAHASTHAAAGSDPVTLSQSQVTNLTTDLAGKAASAHTHAQADVTSLVADLALKAPLASPALTGTPTAPTAAADTNTTQVSTTAFVLGQAGSSSPVVNGTAAAGTSTRFSRQDHVHPTDTSRAASSHTHVQSDVTNLTTDLAAKAPLASPALTGTPTSPTAAVDTNTTQLATTAFVLGQAAGSNPVMDGTVAVGTSTRYARQDHVHPSDTSRAASVHTHAQSDVTSLVSDLGLKAPLASPALTGTPTAPSAAVDTNTTQVATTAFVLGQAAGTASPMNGTAAVGTSTRYARQDHVHASDTSRAAAVHTHAQADVTNLTTDLGLKAPLASPALTGTPSAPTAAADTNTTQLATTAFVVGQAGSATPADLGTAAVGTSLRYARQDHVHKDPFTFTRSSGVTTAPTTGTYQNPFSTYAVAANKTYAFQIIGLYSCAATTYSIRFRLQYPTGTAGAAYLNTTLSNTTFTMAGSTGSLSGTSTTFAPGNPTGTAAFAFRMDGFIVVGATPGNFLFDFTPNAAGSCDIKAGAYLILTEV